MEYTRKNGDTEYRIVNLNSNIIKDFTPFQSEKQQLHYPEGSVLEIKQSDGSAMIIEYDSKKKAQYQINDDRLYTIGFPTAHVFLSSVNGGRMEYAIPVTDANNGNSFCLVSKGTKCELTGDQYFTAAYTLINIVAGKGI